MSKPIIYQRKLIEAEKKLGFLYVPAKARELLPNENAEVNLLLPGEEKFSPKTYNADHNRIFGLTPFYKHHKLKAGDTLSVQVSENLITVNLHQVEVIEDTAEK
jgi:hypothetical protein